MFLLSCWHSGQKVENMKGPCSTGSVALVSEKSTGDFENQVNNARSYPAGAHIHPRTSQLLLWNRFIDFNLISILISCSLLKQKWKFSTFDLIRTQASPPPKKNPRWTASTSKVWLWWQYMWQNSDRVKQSVKPPVSAPEQSAQNGARRPEPHTTYYHGFTLPPHAHGGLPLWTTAAIRLDYFLWQHSSQMTSRRSNQRHAAKICETRETGAGI